jgi:hypothetical protein
MADNERVLRALQLFKKMAESVQKVRDLGTLTGMELSLAASGEPGTFVKALRAQRSHLLEQRDAYDQMVAIIDSVIALYE